MRPFLLLLVLTLCPLLPFGCGDDAGETSPCPDSIRGDDETWSYDGDDPTCEAITESLNEDDGQDELCAGEVVDIELTADGDQCTAEIGRSCDGRTVEVTCDVERDGTADCEAEITAPELDAPCLLRLTAR